MEKMRLRTGKVKRGILSKKILSMAMVSCAAFTWEKAVFVAGTDNQGAMRETVKTIANPKFPQPSNGKEILIVFTEDLSIGSREGDENDLFGNNIFANSDQDGNVYVADWALKTIRKYDPQGKCLQSIGRMGQGPGEFQNIWRPEFDSKGTLYVSDEAAGRISFFDRSGNFLCQIVLPSDIQGTLIDGRGLFVGERFRSEDTSSGTVFSKIFGLFDGQSNVIAEFHRIESVWKPASGSGKEHLINMLSLRLSDSAFKPDGIYAVGSDGRIWFGYPQTYEIRVFNPKGLLTRVIRREYEPRPVSAKDKERFFEKEESEGLMSRPALRSLKGSVFDRIRFPKFKPAYASFALMENGWLAVVVETAGNGDSVFDLFDEEGRYIAHFQAPIPSEGLFFKNGKAYAIKTEDGYKFIKRYGLQIKESMKSKKSGGSEKP